MLLDFEDDDDDCNEMSGFWLGIIWSQITASLVMMPVLDDDDGDGDGQRART